MADDRAVIRYLGVYDADATLWGEVSYWVGARLGRRHCALCDITHGALREKGEWQACRSDLGPAFDTVHRDELPDGLDPAVGGALPHVLAETTDGWVRLLGPEQLEACAGDPAALVAATEQAAAAADLRT